MLRRVLAKTRARNAISLLDPDAEIDEAAGERAEGPVRIAAPDDGGAAARTARGAGDGRASGLHGAILVTGARRVNRVAAGCRQHRRVDIAEALR